MGASSSGPSAAMLDRTEDIRAKLQRYKKEREDFEIVRQQFRQRSEQLGARSQESETRPEDGGAPSLKPKPSGDGNIFAVDSAKREQVPTV